MALGAPLQSRAQIPRQLRWQNSHRFLGRRGIYYQHRVRVVVQVRAHAGQIVHHRQTVGFQLRTGTNARQQQQLRRTEGARRQDHLTAGAHGETLRSAAPRTDNKLDARSAQTCVTAFSKHAGGVGGSHHREVRPSEHWRQVALGSTTALAIAVCGLVVPHPKLCGAVEIAIQWPTRLHARFHECVA